MRVFLKSVSTQDKILALFYFVTLIVSSTLFLNLEAIALGDTSLTKEESIGYAVESRGDVRRKDRRYFIFLPFKIKDYFGLGDTVFVNENSYSILKFKSGTIIKIKQNSLITIYKIGDTLEIDINQGALEVITAKEETVKVYTEDEIIEIDSSSESVSIIKKTGSSTEIQHKKKSVSTKDSKNNAAKDNKIPRKLWNRTIITSASSKNNETADSNKKSSYQFEFPTPSVNKILLIKSSQFVLIQPSDLCFNKCLLEVYYENKTIASSTYLLNTPPSLIIEIYPINNGKYTWKYTSDEEYEEGHFYIKEFSPKNFEYAIKHGHNIEVLD